MDPVTTMVGVMASYFVNITNDHLIHPLIDNLRKPGEPVNHDLEKAVNRSFLSALQGIVRDCHNDLMQNAERNFPIFPRTCRPEYEKDAEWLTQKHRDLGRLLKQIRQGHVFRSLFESSDEIESLLRPTGQFATESIRKFEEKLVHQVLKENPVPECYEQKVRAELFGRICEHFASEIKHTDEVRRIFDSRILAQLNASLADQDKKIENMDHLLTEIHAAVKQLLKSNAPTPQPASQGKWSVKINADILDLEMEQVHELLDKIGTYSGDVSLELRRVKPGSTIFVFEGTKEGYERILSLFKAGELRDLVPGIQIEDVVMGEPEAIQEIFPGLSVSAISAALAEWGDSAIRELQKIKQVVAERTAYPFERYAEMFCGLGQPALQGMGGVLRPPEYNVVFVSVTSFKDCVFLDPDSEQKDMNQLLRYVTEEKWSFTAFFLNADGQRVGDSESPEEIEEDEAIQLDDLPEGTQEVFVAIGPENKLDELRKVFAEEPWDNTDAEICWVIYH